MSYGRAAIAPQPATATAASATVAIATPPQDSPPPLLPRMVGGALAIVLGTLFAPAAVPFAIVGSAMALGRGRHAPRTPAP